MAFYWERMGRIIAPDGKVEWMSTWVGASFARQIGNSSTFEIFVTGRDNQNRSRVGKVYFDIEKMAWESQNSESFNH